MLGPEEGDASTKSQEENLFQEPNLLSAQLTDVCRHPRELLPRLIYSSQAPATGFTHNCFEISRSSFQLESKAASTRLADRKRLQSSIGFRSSAYSDCAVHLDWKGLNIVLSSSILKRYTIA
jgi:hypothetical protein